MLRLRAQADTEDVPCVHDPVNAITTYTLYRLGKKLPDSVSPLVPVVIRRWPLTIDTHIANYLARMKTAAN